MKADRNLHGIVRRLISYTADESQMEGHDRFEWEDETDESFSRLGCRNLTKKRSDGIWHLLCGMQDAWSGWLCVLLVGIAAGSIAAVIDIGRVWEKREKKKTFGGKFRLVESGSVESLEPLLARR